MSPQLTGLQTVVYNVINWHLTLAFVLSVAQLFWIGIEYYLALGDSKKIQTLKEKLPKVIAGLLLVYFSFFITVFFVRILGIYDPTTCKGKLADTIDKSGGVAFTFFYPVICKP